jgi:hypothetical protein
LRVGVVDGVEEAGIAAEDAEEVDGGFVAVEDVRLGAVVGGVSDERDHGALFSLEQVEAGLGEGLSRRLGSGRGGEDRGRSAVQDRAAPRREVVDDSLGLGLQFGLGLLGGKRRQRAGVLKNAGLVSERRDGNRRVYRVEPSGVAELRTYFDAFWSEALAGFKQAVEHDRRRNT